MQILFNIIMLLCLICIPLLHFAAVFFRSAAKPLSVVCLLLHIIALIPLLYFGASLELVFMLYIISLALRQLFHLIFGKRGDKRVL